MQLHRADVCHALFEVNVPFAVLRKPDGALRGLLEFDRGNLPEKDVSAMTGIILQVELDRLKKELAANGAMAVATWPRC